MRWFITSIIYPFSPHFGSTAFEIGFWKRINKRHNKEREKETEKGKALDFTSLEQNIIKANEFRAKNRKHNDTKQF